MKPLLSVKQMSNNETQIIQTSKGRFEQTESLIEIEYEEDQSGAVVCLRVENGQIHLYRQSPDGSVTKALFDKQIAGYLLVQTTIGLLEFQVVTTELNFNGSELVLTYQLYQNRQKVSDNRLNITIDKDGIE